MTTNQQAKVLQTLATLPEGNGNPRARLLSIVVGRATARMLGSAHDTAAILRILRSIVRAQSAYMVTQ